MKTKNKLLASFLLMAVIIGAVGGYGLFNIEKINSGIMDMQQTSISRLETLNLMNENSLQKSKIY
jgi:CHASE3 domain sensor protein